MNAAQRRMKAEEEMGKFRPPCPNDKQMLSIARKIYPALFTDEHTEGNYRMTGLGKLDIVGGGPHSIHVSCHYRVALIYNKLYIRDRKAWLGWKRAFDDERSRRYTPPISLVQRDDIQKSVLEIVQAMKNFFHADVLLLKNYTFENFGRAEMKETFFSNGIRLFFMDEL